MRASPIGLALVLSVMGCGPATPPAAVVAAGANTPSADLGPRPLDPTTRPSERDVNGAEFAVRPSADSPDDPRYGWVDIALVNRAGDALVMPSRR